MCASIFREVCSASQPATVSVIREVISLAVGRHHVDRRALHPAVHLVLQPARRRPAGAPRDSSEARTRSRSSLRSSSAAATIMARTAVQAEAIRSCTSPRPSTSDFSRSTRARVSVSDWRSEAKSVQEAVDGAARRVGGHVPHLGDEAQQLLVDPLADLPVDEPRGPAGRAALRPRPSRSRRAATSQSWARAHDQVDGPAGGRRRRRPSPASCRCRARSPGRSARRVIASPTTAWTSESRSTVSAPRSAVDSSAVTRSACSGSASQAPSRLPMPTARSRCRTTSSERKFSPTNSPRETPSWSFLVGMIAVCGMGRPSGWRNRAVTANQSASAPTMPASAAAATIPGPAARARSAAAHLART